MVTNSPSTVATSGADNLGKYTVFIFNKSLSAKNLEREREREREREG